MLSLKWNTFDCIFTELRAQCLQCIGQPDLEVDTWFASIGSLRGRCKGRQENRARKPHSLMLEEAHQMPQGSSSAVCAGTAERNIESLQLSIRSQHRRKYCCGVLMFSQVSTMSVGTIVVL